MSIEASAAYSTNLDLQCIGFHGGSTSTISNYKEELCDILSTTACNGAVPAACGSVKIRPRDPVLNPDFGATFLIRQCRLPALLPRHPHLEEEKIERYLERGAPMSWMHPGADSDRV